MRARLAIAVSLFLLGCFPSRGCVETCEKVIEDGCEAPAMEACEALCAGLAMESETAGCVEQWGDLEYCMGLDPVCAGDSRCAVERGAYNECVRAYCDSNPMACSD